MSKKSRKTKQVHHPTESQVCMLLKEEKNHLQKIISEAEKRNTHAPEGSVLAKKHKNSVQFYYRSESGDKAGKYMRVSERAKAIALIQKRYDEKLISSAKQQMQIISRFLDKYDPECLENVFLSENMIRREFINPVKKPDALYIDEWQNAEYEHKPFFEGSMVHLTQKNEKVRSKSEVLIANTLYHYGITYRYECPLNIGSRIIYPDFMILRISDRKELFWEHLGMMDDTAYRNSAFLKIQEYEKMGFFPGDQLILTVETYKMPLTQNTINNIVRHYFL